MLAYVKYRVCEIVLVKVDGNCNTGELHLIFHHYLLIFIHIFCFSSFVPITLNWVEMSCVHVPKVKLQPINLGGGVKMQVGLGGEQHYRYSNHESSGINTSVHLREGRGRKCSNSVDSLRPHPQVQVILQGLYLPTHLHSCSWDGTSSAECVNLLYI